jgi:MoxR-like ATPase
MTGTQLDNAIALATRLRQGLGKVIRGRDDTINLIICALLADGHVLLEDYPGSGKTTLSKTLGRLITREYAAGNDHIVPFRRIQFTPDMLPGDVLGVNVFEPKTATFRYMHGPVFAHILLADEINRTGPKVQAAFLECMAEKQVTLDNVTYPLDELFFVLGTQNPLDIAGTYPLPQVQLDRFLFKIPMSYVDRATEVEILADHTNILHSSVSIDSVCTRGEVIAARKVAAGVHLSQPLRECIVDIVQSTRGNPLIQFGASTRAAILLQSGLRAWALIQGRDFVTEDDIKYLAPFVLLHRLRFHAGAGEAKEALNALMAPHLEKLIRSGMKATA